MANDIVERGKKTQFKSGAEAVANGRKGGKASGEAKRKKKTLREAVEVMLALDLTEKEIKDLAKKGYSAETQLDALAAAALIGAKRGNSQMFSNLMRLMGEGVENLQITIDDDSTKAMDAFFDHAREDFKADK